MRIKSLFLLLRNGKYSLNYRDFNLQLKRKLHSLQNIHFICQTWFGVSTAMQFTWLGQPAQFSIVTKINDVICSKFINCLNYSLSSMAVDIKKQLLISLSCFQNLEAPHINHPLRISRHIYPSVYIAISLDAHAQYLLFLTQIVIQIEKRKLNSSIQFWEPFYTPAKF